MSNWGKGVINNIGWGQGANNDIGWGSIYDKSNAGETLLSGGGGSGFDTDYQAVLDYATSEGDTLPSASQQIIGNALVIKLKSLGVWNKLGSLAMFATVGDDGFSLIDWKRLSKMTIEGTVVRTENEGWKGNGTDGTINSGYKLQDLTQFDTSNGLGSFGGWAFDAKANSANPLCGDQTDANSIRGGGADDIQGNRCGINSSDSGLYLINVDGTNAKQYVNGILRETEVIISSETSSNNFHALSEGGSNFSTDKIAILFAGGDLSTGQNDFYNALKTYMDAI
jgi:hypothetical protein